MNYYCPLCKQNHDKEHKIILDYDLYDIKCHKHADASYVSYCTTCNKNLCTNCVKDHSSHNQIGFNSLIAESVNDIEKEMEVLKNNVNDIVKKLNDFIKDMELIIKIKHQLNIESNTNFQILQSIKNFNEKPFIIKDIRKITQENNTVKKYENIINLFEKINADSTTDSSDEITMIYKLDKKSKGIRILGNPNDDHSFFKDYKDKCKLIIKDKEYQLIDYIKYEDFEKYGLNKNDDKLVIKLKGIKNATYFNCMFYNCSSLNSLPDISKWDTKNATNFRDMFSGCKESLRIPSKFK